VNWLTRQEQLVLCGALGLLLVGLAVKTYRTGQSPMPVESTSGSATNTPAAPVHPDAAKDI